MIRPITCICVLLAGGSGLFLYQTKHRTLMLDRQIGQTYDRITAARSKLGILQAEWALLGSPERLAELSDKFLKLQPVMPTQFVKLADLDQRLPPPEAHVAQAGTAVGAGASGPQAAETAALRADVSAANAAPPPAPAPAPQRDADKTPTRLASAHPPEHRRESRREAAAGAAHAAHHNSGARRSEPAERHRPAAAEHEPPAHRAAKPPAVVRPSPRPALAATAPRARPRIAAEARPIRPAAVYVSAPARAAPVYARTPPVTGSLLGGVHAVMAPPVPVADIAAWPRR